MQHFSVYDQLIGNDSDNQSYSYVNKTPAVFTKQNKLVRIHRQIIAFIEE